MAFWIIGGIILIFVIIHQLKTQSKNDDNQQLIKSTEESKVMPVYTVSYSPTETSAPKKSAKPDSNGKKHRVAGVSYHMDEIMRFAHENPEFSMTKRDIIKAGMQDTAIYKYQFDPVTVKLEPEPDNPHDPKAIKVLFNGVHIGYIKAGSCAHIHNLMKADRIESISGRLYGGPSKMVCCYGDSPEDAELEKTNGTVGAEIRIIEKPM